MSGDQRLRTDPRRQEGWTTAGVDGWTIDGSSTARHMVLRDGTGLLRAELPDPRLADDTAYLRWWYRDNPSGRAWERYHYVDGPGGEPLLVAHYVNCPWRYRGPAGMRTNGAWSLHAVTRSGHQRGRHFTRLGLEIYAEAEAEGRSFAVGVTNDKSTGAVVKYMGWRLIGPLPARVVLPVAHLGGPLRRRRRRMESTQVTRAWLGSSAFDDFAAMVNRQPLSGWSTDWTAELLRWRLSCPFAHYRIHVTDDLAAVTTRITHFRLPVTVVLKLFPLVSSGGPDNTLPTDATAVLAAAARRERTVCAVYAGFNGSVRVGGLTPARRLQPSPLNLVVRRLDPAFDQDAARFDTFELLDMDAY